MNNKYKERFKDAQWYKDYYEVQPIIGGAGGIGSHLSFLLSRMGFELLVYDFDTVDTINLAGQFYTEEQARDGLSKVDALRSLIRDFTGTEIDTIDQAYSGDSVTGPVMISAFDNMEARQTFFNAWVSDLENCGDANIKPIFIDGRLNAESMEIYCVTPDRIEDYRKTLFSDGEVPEAPCTLKQTTHCASMIASHICGFLSNHLANSFSGENDRVVPFKWEYLIPFDIKISE